MLLPVTLRGSTMRVWTVCLVAGLLLVGFSGCLSWWKDDQSGRGDGIQPPSWDPSQLSQPLYDLLTPEEVWVTSPVDGKRMHNVVYRPAAEANESFPVFINFSPYWGDTAELGGDAFARYMISEYVPRGYVVVLSAVRGTGHSEGCFQIAGDRELQDMHVVVDYFANQPWSNGAVVAGGKSYDSTTQNGMIAKYPHDALKGIFHVSGITDMYRYNYREGALYPHGLIFNTYYYAQGWHEYGLPVPLLGGAGDQGSLANDDAQSLARLIDDAACTELPAMQAHGIGSALHGVKTDYGVERDWNQYIADSAWNGSIFFVHGFQDWNVKPDHILPWLTLVPEEIRVRAWLHQDTENNGHVYPMRADWNLTMLRWLDQELKGIDTGFWSEPRYELQGSDDIWRTTNDWPAPQTEIGVAEGGLIIEADADTNTSLRYSGEPAITVTVTPQSPDPVLSVILYDEAPSGQREWVNEAVLRLIHRDGVENPQPVVPGQPIEVTAAFYPQDDVLAPGHKWVVAFGEAPRFVGMLERRADPPWWDMLSYDTTSATLHLPLTDLTGAIDPQPIATECFAC